MENLSRSESLWEKLKSEKRPIYLYGTGNGADKIIDALASFGTAPAGVFASSYFVRDRYFRGMKVRSLEDIENEAGDDFVVLLSFGSVLPDVIANVKKIAEKHTLYIPEVPLFGSGLFDADYYEKNREIIDETEELFSEERSKKLFSDMISFRYTGEMKYLSDTEVPKESYASLLSGRGISTVIDCGAYRGDSAEDIRHSLSPSRIIAVESDPKTFIKLCSYADSVTECDVIPVNAVVGNSIGDVTVLTTAGRGSGVNSITVGAKAADVPMITVDSLSEKYPPDFIKYDVEGDEADALLGSMNTLKKYHPALSVSLYHRTGDITFIPLMLRKIYPDAKFYLRRAPCLPAWDLILVVVP